MKRPPSHQTGDIGESFVELTLLKAGWVPNKLERDYGFDLVAQRTTWGRPTWDIMLIQVKSVSSLLPRDTAGLIHFTIETKHLEGWISASIPAFLAIYEMPQNRIFFVSCHEIAVAIKNRYGFSWMDAKTRTIYLSKDAVLSTHLLKKVRKIVKDFWKPIRPSRLESMAMLSNVSNPSWAEQMKPWIFSYWEKRDPIIEMFDQAIGLEGSRFIRSRIEELFVEVDENMEWSGFG